MLPALVLVARLLALVAGSSSYPRAGLPGEAAGGDFVEYLDRDCSSATHLLRSPARHADGSDVASVVGWKFERELRPPAGASPRVERFCTKRVPLGRVDFLHAEDPGAKSQAVDMRSMLWVIITGAEEHESQNFKDRVQPAACTWLRDAPESSVFAVFANTPKSQAVMVSSGCRLAEKIKLNGTEKETEVFACESSGAPTILALLTTCSNDLGHGKYIDGPCCKVDQSILYLAHRGVLRTAKWLYIGDDDMYVDTANVVRMLGVFNASEAYAVNSDGSRLSGKLRAHDWNQNVAACNAQLPQGFFYGIFSTGLVSRLAARLPNRGLASICDVAGGSYDTSLGLWAWRYGALFIPTREQTELDWHTGGGQRPMFVHGVRQPDDFRAQLARRPVDWAALSQRFFPDASVAQRAGRDFGGSGDACASLVGA